MDTKEIKITAPEGYEVDKENSTFECIKFKKKGLTYKDVAEKLFKNKKTYFIDSLADIAVFTPIVYGMLNLNNATSREQLQKILTLNKLINVAEYLNKGWKPNWIDLSENKYSITVEHRGKKHITVTASQGSQSAIIHFKTKKLAEQAIEILGEEEIKLIFKD